MEKSLLEQVAAASLFAEKWAHRGYEKGDTHSFWLELLGDVLGMPDVTTKCRFEQRTNRGGFIDVVISEAKTIVEQKSAGVDLDKPEKRQGVLVTPFEQAKAYADTLPNLQRPDYIVVCNFTQFRVHNLNNADPATDYIEFSLEEFGQRPALLNFLVDPSFSLAQTQEQVSILAGQQIGRLHKAIEQQYVDPTSPYAQHSLNVLCVRLVFCLFAEDAGVFSDGQFYRYLAQFEQPHTFRRALLDLFEVLDTPNSERDPYLPADLLAFPYVNGGLFKERIEIPNFDVDSIKLLIHEVAEKTNWALISPTIFGGVFESTLNPAVRRSGGMHYTSTQNIHKVIDPLFLDDLTQELDHILRDNSVQHRTKKKRLQAYQDKLASLHFFDPAAGSGNFLTETYICLRKLENQVLAELYANQTSLDFDEFQSISPLKVSIQQMHGIEINEFAVHVARTALWIAELQANAESASIIQRVVEDLPLRDATTIRHANALELDWQEILPPSQCNYLIGNPPFIGYSNHSPEQKLDRTRIFGKTGGVLDYVACWYKKAADYMEGTTIQAALVSSNSICQGQQVAPLWKPLLGKGLFINFAYTTFPWGSESTNTANVHVIIVGFSYKEREHKFIYHPDKTIEANHINAYLAPAKDVYVTKRSKPISPVPSMVRGCQPTDGGHLLLSKPEMEELLHAEPLAKPFIRPFSMGEEFIKGKDRYCLWMPDINPSVLTKLPLVRKRVEAVRDMRLASSKQATNKKATTPWRFDEVRQTGDTYIGVPKVSSERRKYIPIGFVTNNMIPGDKLYFISTDSLFVFGVFTSQMHNAWMRVVAGRLTSRYSYSNTIVYNNFVFPDATDAQKERIEHCAQAVLDARASYPDAALKDLYDPGNEWLYPQLMKAHAALDKAVEAAYGMDFGGDEAKMVAHLFELLAEKEAMENK